MNSKRFSAKKKYFRVQAIEKKEANRFQLK